MNFFILYNLYEFFFLQIPILLPLSYYELKQKKLFLKKNR